MKLSKKIYEMLNEQVNAELFSAYLYQAMAAWLNANDLSGMSFWMSRQAQEEVGHAMKLYHYIEERGAMPVLKAIEAPQTSWKNALAVFEEALKHEQLVSDLLKKILIAARKDEDFPTENLMQWYMTEQVEEEDTARTNVYLLSLATSDANLHLVDKEFAAKAANH